MRTTVYMRVGIDADSRTTRGQKPRFLATQRPTQEPITRADGTPIATVAFALDLELPDAMFETARRVIAELKVPEGAAQIAASVTPRED